MRYLYPSASIKHFNYALKYFFKKIYNKLDNLPLDNSRLNLLPIGFRLKMIDFTQSGFQ